MQANTVTYLSPESELFDTIVYANEVVELDRHPGAGRPLRVTARAPVIIRPNSRHFQLCPAGPDKACLEFDQPLARSHQRGQAVAVSG